MSVTLVEMPRTNPRFFMEAEAAELVGSIKESLSTSGTLAYLVGGSVRDGLLGRSNQDIDLSVSGDAVQVARRLARELDGRFILLNERHQAARVVVRRGQRRWNIDLSPLRGPIEEDLGHRDFTINAIALDLGTVGAGWSEVQVFDPLDGCRGLRQGVVRAVSPEAFREDPVRLLRAVRFAAQLGFVLDPGTEEMMQRDRGLLPAAAGERLRDEFCQVLAVPEGHRYLRLMDRLGLLTELVPELEAARGVDQPREHHWDVYQHSLEAVAAVERLLVQVSQLFPAPEWAGHFEEEVAGGHQRQVVLKLTALLHDIGKPATKTVEESGRIRFLGHSQVGRELARDILRRLRFSSRETGMVEAMIEHHLRPGQLAREEVVSRRAVYRYFRDTGEVGLDTLVLSLADHLASRGPDLDPSAWQAHVRFSQEMVRRWFEEQTAVRPPKLIDGHDIMAALGLEPGPRLGELLEAVREAQAAGEVTTREEALGLVARLQSELEQRRRQ